MTDPLTLARSFAEALDRGDHATAAEHLAADCEYTAMGKSHHGRAAIVATYQESWDWAERTLDEVRYESTARLDGERHVIATFVDRCVHNAQAHDYSSEQRLHFDDAGRIRRIEHRELPGQREALVAFFARVGVSRGSASG